MRLLAQFLILFKIRIVSDPGMGLFILMGAFYVAGQYFILQFIKEKTREIRSKSPQLNATHRIVACVHIF